MIFSPYLNNAMSVLLTFTSTAFSISLLFCSSSSFFVGLLKFLSSIGFSESFSFQSRSLSVSTLQINIDFLLMIQKGSKNAKLWQNYNESIEVLQKFNLYWKEYRTLSSLLGWRVLQQSCYHEYAIILHIKIVKAEPINSEFLSTLWGSGYREQIEPDLQSDSFESNTTANVHCLCPTFNKLSWRFDIGVRFRFNVGGDVSSAIVAWLELTSWAGLEFSASRRLLRSSDIGVSLLVIGGGGSSWPMFPSPSPALCSHLAAYWLLSPNKTCCTQVE